MRACWYKTDKCTYLVDIKYEIYIRMFMSVKQNINVER